MTKGKKGICGRETEVYSRIVGYFRPVSNWNKGKRQEFLDRQTYDKSVVNAAQPELITA
jgi:ribonucleoside-triphosphate reductase